MEGYLIEHEYGHHEHQQYCNYPEVAKSFRCLLSDEEDTSGSESSSSSEIPSYTSAVSEPSSQLKLVHPFEETPSLKNVLKLSFSTEENSTISSKEFQNSEEQTTDEEELFEEESVKRKSSRNILNYIDPQGWMKYASDKDPWNKKFYTLSEDSNCVIFRDGILTHEKISERTHRLDQLPESKAFVFSRLHIKKMDLENISVLSTYKYFLYIDMSWNLISDLNALNQCNYLMYLNVSHNRISKVLDFKPPWFLTHVNLCCNEIKDITAGNLSLFWSLTYLDLSFNQIEKIEGLHNLGYLKYLNLSHNFIKEVENLKCTSLQELNLSFNKITGVVEDGCLENLKDLTELNLAHNYLTTLHHFADLPSLKRLDASDNKITEFSEIYNIDGFKSLRDLKMTGNSICSSQGYRQFLIFKLSSLDSLDSVPISFSERVAARMLWEPDLFTRKIHLRSKLEFWNQLGSQTVDPGTVPCDEPPIPLVVLVGTFASNKKEIAERLQSKYPDQVYRFNQVTTIPISCSYNEDNLLRVSINEFNSMIKAGKLLFYYNEIGHLFGVDIDQLVKCVTENKIGIIESTLEGALVLRTSGCHPFLILCVTEDTNSYEGKLNAFFTESNLWKRYHPSNIRKTTTFDESCAETIYTAGELPEASSSCDENSLLRETHHNYSLFTSSNLSYQSLFPYFEKKGTDFGTSTTQKSTFTDKKSTSKPSDLVTLQEEDDDFEWVWTYEPSIICEVEPSESFKNLVRGREEFVQKMLQQQEMYIEMNNRQPGLFTTAVYSDDVDSAVKIIGKTCCDIFNKRQGLTKVESELEKPLCKKFIEARVQSLMKDLINVPLGI